MNSEAKQALEAARIDYARAQDTEDLHGKFRGYISAARNILAAACADPEEPKVKRAMQAILTGLKQKD